MKNSSVNIKTYDSLVKDYEVLVVSKQNIIFLKVLLGKVELHIRIHIKGTRVNSLVSKTSG